MRKLIRNLVFETNSSSCHSISIENGNGVLETLYPNNEGNIVIEGGEFGWEENTYYDAKTKASYMMVYALDWSGNRSEEFQQILKDMIQEHTGCKKVIFKESIKGYWKHGYIDHQSVEDNNYHYLFEDAERLKRFIFNPSSYLVTDHDNH